MIVAYEACLYTFRHIYVKERKGRGKKEKDKKAKKLVAPHNSDSFAVPEEAGDGMIVRDDKQHMVDGPFVMIVKQLKAVRLSQHLYTYTSMCTIYILIITIRCLYTHSLRLVSALRRSPSPAKRRPSC